MTWRQAYIEALVWFDVRCSTFNLVELIWCSLAGRSNGCLVCDGPLAAVGLVPSLCLPSVLVFTISISKLAYSSGFY